MNRDHIAIDKLIRIDRDPVFISKSISKFPEKSQQYWMLRSWGFR
jgi:hypothetical protein